VKSHGSFERDNDYDLGQRNRESLEKGVILAEDGEALFKNERYGKNVLLMRLSSLVDGSSVGLLVKPRYFFHMRKNTKRSR